MFLLDFLKRKVLNSQILDAEDEFEAEDEDQEEDEFEEEPDSEEMQEQVYEWGREWSQTPAFEGLTLEQKNQAEGILANFTQYMYDYHEVAPEEWATAEMEYCCLDTLPRKVSAEEGYFRAIAPVLASFFTFLHKTNRLPNGLAMAHRIRGLDKKIVAASQDPRYWGPAKSFVMAALGKGVDVRDNAQMESFMTTYNAQQMAQAASPTDAYLIAEEWDTEDSPEATTYVREGPKVGRNDPCPCGSGKKYKKCCGSA